MERTAVHVLMVDDDEEEYIVVGKYLKKATTASYDVEWVSSFDAALEMAAKGGHDICLLDYQLGEHTGIEVLRELRARGHELPVILLTGHGNVEIDLQAMESGATDYLEKTELTPILLERSIRYAVENFRVRKALREANEELERRVEERTAELNRSNVELEQFAAVVARDLQEPLHVLARYIADLDVRKPVEPSAQALERLAGSLETVFMAVRNMELLVRIVLDYSRTRGQRAPFEDVDIAEVAREVLKELAHQIQKVGAKVEVGELPTVKADRLLVKGLLENVFDNALRYRGSEPLEVSVSSTRRGDSWVCQVADNGQGISEEDADEVFLMYVRGGRSRATPGVGIGLALCRKIVEYHGGRTWIDSPGAGGTKLYFTLPAE